MWANHFEVQCPIPYDHVAIRYAFVRTQVHLHGLNSINRIQTACYIFFLEIPQLSLNRGIRFVFLFFNKRVSEDSYREGGYKFSELAVFDSFMG
jgi:hypothetical protein